MDPAAEAAVGGGDHVLPADRFCEPDDAFRDEFGMRHGVGEVRDHAGQDDLPVGQLHVPPDLPLVLVPRVGRLERVRAGVDRGQDVLEGAEAILTLRAVISNGDFGEYWRFHVAASTSGSTLALPRGRYTLGPNPPSLETSCTHRNSGRTIPGRPL